MAALGKQNKNKQKTQQQIINFPPFICYFKQVYVVKLALFYLWKLQKNADDRALHDLPCPSSFFFVSSYCFVDFIY